MSIRLCITAAVFASQALIFSQTPSKFVNPWVSVAQPGVPSDPLEVAHAAEPVQDIAQRATAIKLLENAQFLSNVRRSPYDLKTHFTTSEGTWQMEDSSPGRNVYRWTVQGPSYVATNLFQDRVGYSNQPASSIPLRVAQVHSALFAHYPAYGPRATLRLSSGNLNGVPVTCVLVSHTPGAQSVSGPRRWEEYESCMDPRSGLLMSYSPAPGLYVLYDYWNAPHLGDIIFPSKFTITEAGQTVAEAQVDSLTQASTTDPSIYTPAGLNAIGVGFPLVPPWKMEQIIYQGQFEASPTTGHFVVVRGMVSPDGALSDAQVLASSNPALNDQALQRVAQRHAVAPPPDQNGATPQSHEVFYVTLFLTN